MFPLLLKDGLALPSVSLAAFYVLFCVYFGFLQPVSKDGSKPAQFPKPLGENFVLLQVFFVSLVGCAVLVAASVGVSPPQNLPDLWPLLVSVYAAAHFVAFLAYFYYVQFLQAFQAQPSQKKKKQ
jgi:drug/metabolite transporter (DMT)-like permease